MNWLKSQIKKTNWFQFFAYWILMLILMITIVLIAALNKKIVWFYALSAASGIIIGICIIVFTNRFFAFSIWMIQWQNFFIKRKNAYKQKNKKENLLLTIDDYKNKLQTRSFLAVLTIFCFNTVVLIISLIISNLS